MVSIGKKGKMLRPRMGGLRNPQGPILDEVSIARTLRFCHSIDEGAHPFDRSALPNAKAVSP